MQQRSIYISLITFIACCICPHHIAAQDSTSRVTKPCFIHSSFYYDFPKSFGAAAGIDFPLSSKVKFSIDKNGIKKLRYRDWILNADIGFYRNRFSNTGVFIVPSIGKRYYKQGPYYFELLIGAGVVRTFYDGIVYTVDDNGKVEIKKDYGRFYASTNIATSFGWNFESSRQPKPFALQLKPVLWFQFPYNSFMLPHLSVEAGFKYHFRNFNVHVKQKEVFVK